MSSIYRMPAAHFRARATLTNTSPTRPYRSAGRPGSDLRHGAADRSRRARMRLRPRRRCAGAISSAGSELPYSNPFGMDYDSGDYQRAHGHGAQARRLGRLSSAAAPRRKSAANAAASASPIMSISPPACRARRPRSRSSPTAWSSSSSAPSRRARATRRASRSWSPNGSACRSTPCGHRRRHRPRHVSAAAPIPAAACGSARS